MAIDLTGISNENEFYSHHYLSAILETDLKDVFARWRASQEADGTDAARLPHERLRSLSRAYFQTRAVLSRERRPEDRLQAQRSFAEALLAALGYEYAPSVRDTDDGHLIPVLAEVRRASGAPQLWVLEAVDAADEGQDPLELKPVPVQFPDPAASDGVCALDYDTLVSRHVFGRSEPPRWVLLVSDRQLLLLDRGKWNEKRLLRFNLEDILGRRETSTLQATAALLHRDSVCPADGLPLLDTLDEKSHKHAFGVSEELKYALREAIELLGNEAVYYLRERLHEKVFGRNLAEQLTVECLRWMYRMLFVFYIEARPELGYAPVRSDAYRKGYSLESLRDLEMVDLTTDQDGYYLHDSLTLLFRLIYEGCGKQPEQMQLEQDAVHHTFTMAPLRSHLFDPERTPLLGRVRFRNSVLRRVIELMSLSRPKGGKDRRGRISYAQLGINQLGAVYEALLSFRGFFAETDLYEVRKAPKKGAAAEASPEETDAEDADTDLEDEDDAEDAPARGRGGKAHDVLENAYFVPPEKLPQYTEDERVYDEDGRLKLYPKGTFIYRLAGRDREKSASYYTPEVLTKCLVKYALKELLEGKSADDILQLHVCEPAMGSAAFLNEAVNQLAEAYLDRKQKELGETIPHDEYAVEKQKVKMYLADNRVFGVDLNPVAAELAEVSLWLNSIYEGAYVPWFGLQLHTGNSLVGARRQVFGAEKLGRLAKGDASWLKSVPERIIPGTKREPGTVYHFLVPNDGMAAYKDKVIKEIAPDEIKKINERRKALMKPFTDTEIRQLESFSEAVDRLWARHASELSRLRNLTTDPLHVFGQPPPPSDRPVTDTAWKDAQAEKFLSPFSPYRRLKLVMDYWCALWFWPIEKADLLPSRQQFMLDMSLLLEVTVVDSRPATPEQLALFEGELRLREQLPLPDGPAAEVGMMDTDRLCEEVPRLALVRQLAERYRFLHWELEFADLFADRGGFDLVLGNPPWIKVEWNEGGVMADQEPLFVLHDAEYSASRLRELRDDILKTYDLRSTYLQAYEETAGIQNIVCAPPILRGVFANLYKCFLELGWWLGRTGGWVSLLHQPGLLEDPKGGGLRNQFYPRLKLLARFQNWYPLFKAIKKTRTFCMSITSARRPEDIDFFQVSNLIHPTTLDESFAHDGHGRVPGIKTEANKWEVRGHGSRIVRINDHALSLFATLYDPPGTIPQHARLPIVHSQELLDVLASIAESGCKVADSSEDYLVYHNLSEEDAGQDGILRKMTMQPRDLHEWIVEANHLYVATPMFRSPNENCRSHRDWSIVDLSRAPDDFIPRTNYTPRAPDEEYLVRMPRWLDRPITQQYRIASRRRLSPMSERTLITTIIPPGPAALSSVFTIVFSSLHQLVAFAGFSSSILADFFVKSIGKSDGRQDTICQIPLPNWNDAVALRVLRLNCVTHHYAHLWESLFTPSMHQESFAKCDSRLRSFRHLGPSWASDSPLRTPYARRQALVELDALAALFLDISVDQLCTVYGQQFPILQKHERETYYDQRGEIVFTPNSEGLPGVGLTSRQFQQIRDAHSRHNLPEFAAQYTPPFDHCDREADMRQAYSHFQSGN